MNNYSKTARLGDILLHKKEITQDQLNECLRLQKGSGKKLGEILIEKDFVTEDTVLNTLSEQL
ncbi:MAG TPA: type II secretion system protein GspE, partial [Clostridiales bacterium]|nr:type II secretion system protein GspE [Clostridiales bacterium]